MANIIGGSIGAGKAILNDYTLGVEDIDGGHRLTITRGSEVQTLDVLDGKNGADGKDGAPGADGRDGIDGKDGAPGAVQTVNGEAPDENGNVQVSGLPDGAGANMQLVTDADGTAKWEDRLAYTNTIIQTMIEEQTVTTVENNGLFAASLSCSFGLETGETYTVNFDGTEYTCTASKFNSMVYIGNISIIGIGNNTEEPFFIVAQGSECVLSTPSSGTYIVSVIYESTSFKQIGAQYLPEIPAEKLPEIPAEKLPFVEQKTFEGSFDKVTDGRDKFVWNNFSYYKFSKFSPRREDVISFSGTRASGDTYSDITEGENCCEYGFFIVVYQAGQCTLAVNSTTQYSFNAPSAGLYAKYTSGNDSQIAGTYNFTLRLVRNMIQSSTTYKRYYLDVDDSGALIATEVTE